jgi:hypothetical protein
MALLCHILCISWVTILRIVVLRKGYLSQARKDDTTFFLPPPRKNLFKYESSFLGLLATASSCEKLRKAKSTLCIFPYCVFLQTCVSPRLPLRVRGNTRHRSHTTSPTHSPLASCRLLMGAAAAMRCSLGVGACITIVVSPAQLKWYINCSDSIWFYILNLIERFEYINSIIYVCRLHTWNLYH